MTGCSASRESRLAVDREGAWLPVDRRPLIAVLAGNTISVTGDSLTQLGVPWYVLQSTGSPARAGLVAFCSLFPLALSALACGPLIDRVGRRRMSVLSDLACGVSIAAVPVLQLSGVLRFWMLCGLMACAGVSSAPGVAARQVLIPGLAERAGMRLVRVASLYDGAARCAAMIGAALGGLLIGLFGPSHVLLADAATFGASASLVGCGLRSLPAARPVGRCTSRRPVGRHASTPPVGRYASARGPSSRAAYWQSLRDGFGRVARTPLLLGICLTALAAQGLDQGWSSVLLPVDVRVKLGSVLDLGLLETVFALCALAGALLYGAVGHRWRRWPVFTVAFLIVGMPRFVVAGLTSSVLPLALMMAIEGLACGALNPIRNTVVFENVPEHLRSPVVSAMTAAGLAAAPFGGLVAGILVASLGLRTTTLAIGSVYLAVTLCPLMSASWRQIDKSTRIGRRNAPRLPHRAQEVKPSTG
ncbi:MAG TPA: MFS transporter [Trebonia sp.]|nr:MFS transporter [Trebonia sp.]